VTTLKGGTLYRALVDLFFVPPSPHPTPTPLRPSAGPIRVWHCCTGVLATGRFADVLPGCTASARDPARRALHTPPLNAFAEPLLALPVALKHLGDAFAAIAFTLVKM